MKDNTVLFYDDNDEDIKQSMKNSLNNPNVQSPNGFTDFEMDSELQFPSPSIEFPTELLDQLVNEIPISTAAGTAGLLQSDPFLSEAEPIMDSNGGIAHYGIIGGHDRSIIGGYNSYDFEGLHYGTGSNDFNVGATTGYASAPTPPAYHIPGSNLPSTLLSISSDSSTAPAVGTSEQEILRYLKDESDVFPATPSPSTAVVPSRSKTTAKSTKTAAAKRDQKKQQNQPAKGKRKRTSSIGSTASSSTSKSRSYRWGECMTHQAVKARQRRRQHKQELEQMEVGYKDLQDEIEQLRSENSAYQRQFSTLRSELDHVQKLIHNSDELHVLMEQLSAIPESSIQALIAQFNAGRRRKRLQSANGHEAGRSGICLHVQNGKFSVEFCSECDRRAQAAAE